MGVMVPERKFLSLPPQDRYYFALIISTNHHHPPPLTQSPVKPSSETCGGWKLHQTRDKVMNGLEKYLSNIFMYKIINNIIGAIRSPWACRTAIPRQVYIALE